MMRNIDRNKRNCIVLYILQLERNKLGVSFV